ncbi:MAG: hypothetical protein R6V19_02800, partial [Armatimonadota bacterium]
MSNITEPELKKLQHELRQRNEQMEAVRRISAALSQVIEVDELAQQALDVSLECVGAEAGTV